MLYYLTLLKAYFSGLNVFSYITFRAGGAILTGFLFTCLLAPKFIQYIRRNQITQLVREDGPQSHQSKTGTPTMGGLLILLSTVSSTLLWARWDNPFVWICLFTEIYLGVLGAIDDIKKWKSGGSSKGISPAVKLCAQMVLAIGVVTYLFISPPNPSFLTKVNIPYFKDLFWDLGFFYIFFAVMIIVGSSNAVNLTDGLDGLAIGSLVISSLTYAIFAYLAGHALFSKYLRIIPVSGAGELSILLAAIVGAGLGFLWFNSYPAQIFMGDTGSLFLGGTLGVIALLIKQELILIIVGGLFVIEALSVLLQVYSYRIHGKRIFRMAPLHHHFELCGWLEPKVTVRFWIVAIILCLLALTSLKVR